MEKPGTDGNMDDHKCKTPGHYNYMKEFVCKEDNCLKEPFCGICLSELHPGHLVEHIRTLAKSKIDRNYSTKIDYIYKISSSLISSSQKQEEFILESKNLVGKLKNIIFQIELKFGDHEQVRAIGKKENEETLGRLKKEKERLQKEYKEHLDLERSISNSDQLIFESTQKFEDLDLEKSKLEIISERNTRLDRELAEFQKTLLEFTTLGSKVIAVQYLQGIFHTPSTLVNILQYLSVGDLRSAKLVCNSFTKTIRSKMLIELGRFELIFGGEVQRCLCIPNENVVKLDMIRQISTGISSTPNIMYYQEERISNKENEIKEIRLSGMMSKNNDPNMRNIYEQGEIRNINNIRIRGIKMSELESAFGVNKSEEIGLIQRIRDIEPLNTIPGKEFVGGITIFVSMNEFSLDSEAIRDFQESRSRESDNASEDNGESGCSWEFGCTRYDTNLKFKSESTARVVYRDIIALCSFTHSFNNTNNSNIRPQQPSLFGHPPSCNTTGPPPRTQQRFNTGGFFGRPNPSLFANPNTNQPPFNFPPSNQPPFNFPPSNPNPFNSSPHDKNPNILFDQTNSILINSPVPFKYIGIIIQFGIKDTSSSFPLAHEYLIPFSLAGSNITLTTDVLAIQKANKERTMWKFGDKQPSVGLPTEFEGQRIFGESKDKPTNQNFFGYPLNKENSPASFMGTGSMFGIRAPGSGTTGGLFGGGIARGLSQAPATTGGLFGGRIAAPYNHPPNNPVLGLGSHVSSSTLFGAPSSANKNSSESKED